MIASTSEEALAPLMQVNEPDKVLSTKSFWNIEGDHRHAKGRCRKKLGSPWCPCAHPLWRDVHCLAYRGTCKLSRFNKIPENHPDPKGISPKPGKPKMKEPENESLDHKFIGA